MAILNKQIIFFSITVFLVGCGSVKTDMTKSKSASETTPSIYSSTLIPLSYSRSIRGNVIKIDNKKITAITGHRRIFLDPGLHTIEMFWMASEPPIFSSKYKAIGDPSAKRNFTMKVRVREGHSYFVNLQDSIIGKNYKIPNRLCISEVKNNSKLIRVAPDGNIVLENPVKILTCSS